MRIIRSIVLLSTLAIVQAFPADTGKGTRLVALFNGRNLEGFDTFLKSKGLNNDPEKVFQVKDGMLHISGAEFGYVITKQEYENYYLRAEFKWVRLFWNDGQLAVKSAS